MSDIYTGIDLGTDSIKIIVCEKVKDKYHVLAAHSAPSFGIKDGFITDMKTATNSVKNAIKVVNAQLGINISKVIACIPPTNCRMDIVSGKTTIIDYNDITGVDVSNVLLDSIKSVDLSKDELVTAMPIHFTIDDETAVKDPKKMKGTNLSARVVVSTTPKEPLYKILEVLRLSGLETIDICFSSFGDYYALEDKKNDELVGAIINIGEESTNVSIFNRGIQIKNGSIPVGSKNVDKDLTYAFKTKISDSKMIKEKFAVALSSLADETETWKVKVDRNEEKEISQISASKVVEARIKEILKLAKNEIKNLTNREIRYIMISGGLSEMNGFANLAEKEFGFVANVINIPTMGIRHNKYSSCYGVIRYFNEKLSLRGKEYKMFSKEEIEEMLSSYEIPLTQIKKKISEESIDN